MNTKVNTILIGFVAIFFAMLAFSIYLKFSSNFIKNEDSNEDDKNKTVEVGEEKKLEHEISYYDKYKDKIINDNTQIIEYSLFKGNSALYGNIIIDTDNKLYITDDIINKKYLLFNYDVKTIITNEINARSMFNFYVITTLGDLYKISILDTNLSSNSSILVNKLNLPERVTNFTSLCIKSLINDYCDGVTVIGESGKIYHSDTMTEYEESTINVFGKYIVYADRTITDFNKKLLKNSEGNNYIVKKIIATDEVITYLGEETSVIIITDDNNLIYLNRDGNTIVYSKKVLNILELDNYTCDISFEDNSHIKFKYFAMSEI